jgi:hypothetical protein
MLYCTHAVYLAGEEDCCLHLTAAVGLSAHLSLWWMPSINVCQKQNQIFTEVLYKNKERTNQRTDVTLSSQPDVTLLVLHVSLEGHFVILKEYFLCFRGTGFLVVVVLPLAGCLSFSVFLRVARRAYWWDMWRREREGAKLYNEEKVWSSITH